MVGCFLFVPCLFGAVWVVGLFGGYQKPHTATGLAVAVVLAFVASRLIKRLLEHGMYLRIMSLIRRGKCPACAGKRVLKRTEWVLSWRHPYGDHYDRIETVVPCDTCRGTGRYLEPDTP